MTQQRPILAASAAIFRGGEVLLVQRGNAVGLGLWSLPGGKVEFGERAKAAAAREVREETGVIVELRSLAGFYEIIAKPTHYAIACYAGVHIAGEPVPASDALQAKFVALHDVASFDLALHTVDAIQAARAILGI
ncbi:NUDIX domain-containing protein [Aestuariivirga litoralis]|uniref:NUDIX domain-containing protein n=1 Tax=Aestuariivirga litoralis TaxID=2650924 RepID=UPI0018C5B7BB